MTAFVVACGGPSEPPTAAGSGAPPGVPGTSSRYIVYLHGRIIEDEGLRPTHPRFGVYEYQDILDTFDAAGFTVVAPVRPPGADPSEHARVTADEVRRLLDIGVPAEHITVVGFSKGGAIAVLTAAELGNPHVNFVFIACCSHRITSSVAAAGGHLTGRMLSIYEASDAVGSCSSLFERAAPDSSVAEVEVEIGGGHGAFYRPHPDWVGPVTRWARGETPNQR